MSHEIDRQCARAMGLEIIHEDWPCGVPPDGCSREAALRDDGDQGPWYNTRGAIYKVHEPEDEWRSELGLWCEPVPLYSSDPDAARQLEDEIERRGRWELYILALARICEVERTFTAAWALIRATPEQKARAFLEVAKQ